MPVGSLAPYPRLQFFDNSGNPLNGGLLHTYAAGTLTRQTAYTDEALTVAHANPIVLDSAGRATVYLDALRYRFILQNSAGTQIWDVDPVPATHVPSSQVGDVIVLGGAEGQAVSDAAYASGAGAENLAPGSKILPLDSDDLVGTWRLRGMLKTDGGTVTVGLVNLTDGSPDSAIREISSSSTAGAQVTSTADIVFAAGGATKNYGVKLRVASGVGFAWGIELVRVA